MEHDTTITRAHNSFMLGLRHLFFGTKNRAIVTVIASCIVVFGMSQLLNSQKKQPQYQTAQVTRGTLIASVTETGNVASSGQGAVGSPTTGIIQTIFVKNGDQVTQGQNLFTVKSIATPQERATALASFLSAQNTLNSAKAKMDSLQAALFQANQAFVNDKGIANPTDQQKADPKYIEENANWLQAEADYTNQQGVIAAAQASYAAASLSYQATQDSTVTAPISGTVANISVQPGDQVTASSGNLSSELSNSSSNSSGGSAVLTIGDFSKPYIKVQASEVDIPSIKAGEKATMTLNAYPGKTFVGQVNQVDTVGTVSSGVVTYNVYIGFIAAPSGIEPGMSATVTIQTARKDDVLSVPSAAVQTVAGQTTVRVLENGKVTNTPVTTGMTTDTDTEITSGLSEGQTVVIGIQQSTPTASGTSPFSTGLRGGFGGGFGGGARTGGGGARGGQ